MATIGNKNLTLLDVAKRSDKNDHTDKIVEILSQQSCVMADAVAVPCNEGKSHKHTIRSGLPDISWGALYKGIPQSKSETTQVVDTTGFIEALSSVDKRLINLAKDKNGLRLSEATAFLEAMAQEVDRAFFYYDTATDPDKIKGLAARYSQYDASKVTSTTARQVIHGGGSGSNNTSIWFVTWGEEYTHLIYPDTVTAGLQREDKGEQKTTDASGNTYWTMDEMFTQHLGVAVKDWRNNARIANIDVAAARNGTVKIYDLLRKAYYALQKPFAVRGATGAGGKTVIYMNRDMMELCDAIAANAGSTDNFVRLKTEEIEGKMVTTYRGIPIVCTDAILNTEALVPSV